MGQGKHRKKKTAIIVDLSCTCRCHWLCNDFQCKLNHFWISLGMAYNNEFILRNGTHSMLDSNVLQQLISGSAHRIRDSFILGHNLKNDSIHITVTLYFETHEILLVHMSSLRLSAQNFVYAHLISMSGISIFFPNTLKLCKLIHTSNM